MGNIVQPIICAVVLSLLNSISVVAGEKGGFRLELIVEPGPWTGVSALVGFGGQVWFANSVKFVNHNSADVYSYDPYTGRTRYESHLFSQDAGDPVVQNGLLYWPFEDPRFSADRAEFMVTNGRDWDWHDIPAAKAFHFHALGKHDGSLYAATSAWRAGIQKSNDRGLTWRSIYDHPTPDKRVSRIVTLTSGAGRLYAGLSDPVSSRSPLLEIKGNKVRPLHSAPAGFSGESLVLHRNWLYASIRNGEDRVLWRTNGTSGEVVPPPSAGRVNAMASGDSVLWAVTTEKFGGALWSSSDSRNWSLIQRFERTVPIDVLDYRDNVYVSTYTNNGSGALWGTRHPVSLHKSGEPVPLPQVGTKPSEPMAELSAELNRVWADDVAFDNLWDRLMEVLTKIEKHEKKAAGNLLVDQLINVRLSGNIDVFGGNYKVSRQRTVQWYLLRAIARNGSGPIPVRFLRQPWDEADNSAEKYFHPAPAAAWAIGRSGQNDESTLTALVNGLDRMPDWLVGDHIGALSAVTGERFGYDVSAWRSWWSKFSDILPVPTGFLSMGSETGADAEKPVHRVYVRRFYLDRKEVTNESFEAFVRATAYVTDAEKSKWGWHWTGRWRRTQSADWRHPFGPDSDIDDLARHPVVQVSWNDAQAYCKWLGKRLPTEAEWERAARGKGDRQFAWGSSPPHTEPSYRASMGAAKCCSANDADGHGYTAPVGSFPNGSGPFGHQDLTGNVWEWVRDWYAEDFYTRSATESPVNEVESGSKVIRGGGWGNNPWGLRATLRHYNRPDYGLSMVGFRCARDAPAND